MRKPVILIAALAILMSFTCKLYGQQISARMQNEKLARGVNIIGYDDALWKDHTKGRFKEGYFKMIKDAGFSNIRINLQPFSHMDKNYKLDGRWLETLDWAVKNGLDAGLMVIIDMHEYNAIGDDPVGKKEMFLSVWRQLAPRYKDYSSDLIFEVLNEPCNKLTPELWNALLPEAMKIIRSNYQQHYNLLKR